MEILVKDMSMPKVGGKIITIYADGRVLYDGGYTKAVPVPPHGRLIDESEFFARLDYGIKTISSLSLPEDFVALYVQLAKEIKEEIGKCRTIIPASEEVSA